MFLQDPRRTALVSLTSCGLESGMKSIGLIHVPSIVTSMPVGVGVRGLWLNSMFRWLMAS